MKEQKKLFLIRAAGFKTHSIPYGILYIKSYLRKFGINSFVYDREINSSIESLKKSLNQFSPDIIGISAMTFQAEDAKFIIEQIRNWVKDKVIIVGGVHFTSLPAVGVDFGADLVIRGEGELALLDLIVNGYKNKEKIIQGKPLKNLDEIPMLKVDDIKPFVKTPKMYHEKGFHIITARGCPYNCNFCLGVEQRPKGLRYHSIDNVVEYISQIVKNFGINSFNIVDDIFVLKSSRVLEFCDKVREKIKKPLKLHCFTHAGHGNGDLYRKMKNTGFHKISMGVEHGNEDILKMMGKNTTKVKIEETCNQIYQAGIRPNLTYMLGNIKETDETITETIDFAIYLHKKYKTTSWFSFMQPLPGSPVYEVAELYGRYLKKNCTHQNIDLCYIPFEVTIDHIIKERERGMKFGNSKKILDRFKLGLIKSFKKIKNI